jgi:hypothetical protein
MLSSDKGYDCIWSVDDTVLSDHDFVNLNLNCAEAVIEASTSTYPNIPESQSETKIYFTASSVSSHVHSAVFEREQLYVGVHCHVGALHRMSAFHGFCSESPYKFF